MKKYILIFILLGLIGFTGDVRACPVVRKFDVKGLYYGNFPVRVEDGSAWDVECALNTWEEYINRYASYCYNLFVTIDISVPSFVTGGIGPDMDPTDIAAIDTDLLDNRITIQQGNKGHHTPFCFHRHGSIGKVKNAEWFEEVRGNRHLVVEGR